MRISFKSRKTISKVLSILLLCALGFIAIFGISALSNKLKEEKKVIYPIFEVGGIDADGKGNRSKDSICTKDSFECKGLEVNLGFDAYVKYQIFYYNNLDEFLEASSIYTESAEMDVPANAVHARIVVIPIWGKDVEAEDRICHWYDVTNYSSRLEIKVLKEQEPKTVDLTIGEFKNGEVTADKDNYNVGDVVTLTIAPAYGFAQKLYINGTPLILNWKTYKYSFVATETEYEITGTFEKVLSLSPNDVYRWSTNNQAHGVFTTYYPNNNDSWWMNINGEYKSVEITAKNYLPVAESMDGNGKEGYHQVLSMSLSNGKTYSFRIYNDKGDYAVSCTPANNAVTGWGNWQKLDSAAAFNMNGDGVQFKVARTSADILTISINGVTMFTYKMDGVTSTDKVVSVGIQSVANSGEYVTIPFVLN